MALLSTFFAITNISDHLHVYIIDFQYLKNHQLQSFLNEITIAGFKRKDYSKAARVAILIGYSQKESNDKASAMKAFKDAEHYGKLSGDSLITARAQFNIARFMFVDHEYDWHQ